MPKSFVAILFFTLLATITHIGASVYKILVSKGAPILTEEESAPLPEEINFEALDTP